MRGGKAEDPLGLAGHYDLKRDGVSFSLLQAWQNCRERARLKMLRWTPKRKGVGQIFGTICHGVMERVYGDTALEGLPTAAYIKKAVRTVDKTWRKENPRADAETLSKLEMMCLLAEQVMSVYFQFHHADFTAIKWTKLEEWFEMPLGNSYLKGQIDGRFKPTLGKKKRRWVFESKTKSRIGEQGESNLVDILPFELQANLYIRASEYLDGDQPGGLLYNIIRRPGLEQKKSETIQQFAKRLGDDIRKRPAYYFIRLRLSLDPNDIQRNVQRQDALMKDFEAWVRGDVGHYPNSDQCEHKHGTCEFIAICARNDYTGFYQRPRSGRKGTPELEER